MDNTNEKKNLKIIWNILKVIIILILLPIIFFNSVIIIDSIMHKDKIPSFFGWKPFIVMSGSMQAELYAGDVAIIKEVDTNSLKVGDIIAYQESKDFVVTHRVIDDVIDEDGNRKFVTKGDNNNEADFKQVSMEQVEGKYVGKISKIGYVLLFIQTPIGTVISVSIPIAILLILHAIENKKNSKYIQNEENKNESLKQEIERLKQENEQLTKGKEKGQNEQ